MSTQCHHPQQVYPAGNECAGSNDKHCTVLTAQKCRSMKQADMQIGIRRLWQFWASGGFPSLRQRTAGRKTGNIPRRLRVLGRLPVGDLDTKEQDKDYAARTRYKVGS